MRFLLLSLPLLVAPQDEPSPIAEPIARADAAIDAIVARPPAERTFANTVRAIDDVQARFFEEARYTGFLAQVATDPDVRAVGRRASADLSNWFDRLYQREELSLAVRAIADAGLDLVSEDARYLERLLRDFRRAGMELAPEGRSRLKAIEEELNELSIEFRTNIDEDERFVLLTEGECKGVPEDFLASLPRHAGLVQVDLEVSVARRFWDLCEVEDTRKKLSVAFSFRAAPENVEVLENVLALRADKARLLGYPSIAHFETEIKMAESPERVLAFYDELRPRLREKALADLELYRDAKRRHTGDPDAELESWDTSFYKSTLLRERYAVDREEVRKYFPVQQVVQGVFAVTQELFGLRFEDATGRASEKGLPLWHEDVRLYEVFDRERGELLGEFYTDLHPRPGKYSHAAQFPLRVRKRWPDGSLTRPLVALVCNFTKPTAERPSLLSHDEVETLFHEFGHCLHSILTEAEYAEFAGTSVARDFVEAPSQMLENWTWNADVLARFARHHETGEPLPRAILDGMVAAKNLGSGLSTEAQVFLGLLDMTYHTDPGGELDTTAVRDEVYAETRLFEPLGLPGQASFGHLMGYHAGYYGYLWSLVYAQDMFSRFEEAGIMDPEVARAYRDQVLAKGGTVDAFDLVVGFLGREPSLDAFLRHLGLE